MTEEKTKWQLNRQINISVIFQVITLAGLILGSWVNLQRQLDLLQHDVKQMLTAQEKFCERYDVLQEKCISYEYRLRRLEEEKSIKQ